MSVYRVTLLGRVINNRTKNSIKEVSIVFIDSRTGTELSRASTDIDGEFEMAFTYSDSRNHVTMKLDKDPGYKYKIMNFSITGYDPIKDFGDIEMQEIDVPSPRVRINIP